MSRPLGLPLLEAAIENRMGLVQVRQGRMDEAEQAFRHVIEVTAARHDPYLQAASTGNLGFLFLNSFQLEEAAYWFDKARVLFQQLGNKPSYYITMGNLGSCYQRLGDSDAALADFKEAEEGARISGDRYREQLWIGNSGAVLYDHDDLPHAAEKFKRALEIAQSLDKNEKDLTGWWYYSLASTSIDLGDFDAAQQYNKEAIRLRQAVGDRSDFYPRVNEAHIAAGRKDPRAEELYRGLLEEYREGMNPVPCWRRRPGSLRCWPKKDIRSGRRPVSRGACASGKPAHSAGQRGLIA